jgi:pimeloyl-ACP methyl ester carboxylesterase
VDSTRRRVLALPGLLCDGAIWQAQADGLQDVADVTVADFSQLDDLTAMAQAALDLIGGRLDVVGHSMGARVAFEVWRLAPERVRSLVVMDTGTHPAEPHEPASRQRLLDVSAQQGMRALAAAWLPPMVHPARRADPVFMAPLVDMVMRATPEQHARQIRALLNRPDAGALLATITVPTLVVVGRQDEWSPLTQHEQIAVAVPTARLEVVEDSGHMVTLEQPDVVTALLRDWLDDRIVDNPGHGVTMGR